MTVQDFLAGPDELGDHVCDYSRAVQKESCMGGGGGVAVTGTSLWSEGLKKSTHEGEKNWVKGS